LCVCVCVCVCNCNLLALEPPVHTIILLQAFGIKTNVLTTLCFLLESHKVIMEVVPCVCDEEDVENVLQVRLPIFIYDRSIAYLSLFFTQL
jgi:hypothetical protein